LKTTTELCLTRSTCRTTVAQTRHHKTSIHELDLNILIKISSQMQSHFFRMACNATDLFKKQTKAWITLFVGAVEVNTLAQGALRRVSTFQLRCRHATTELISAHHTSTTAKWKLHHVKVATFNNYMLLHGDNFL